MRPTILGATVAAAAMAFAWDATPAAQDARKANWLTDGYDPQRTSWQRNETLHQPGHASRT